MHIVGLVVKLFSVFRLKQRNGFVDHIIWIIWKSMNVLYPCHARVCVCWLFSELKFQVYSNQFHFICVVCLFLRSFRSLRFRAFHHRLDEQISAINSIALFRFVINIADLNCESCKISKVNPLIVTKSIKRFYFFKIAIVVNVSNIYLQ